MLWRDKDVDESRRRLNPALSLPFLIWCRWTISIVWLTPSKRLVHVHVEKQNKVKRGVVFGRPIGQNQGVQFPIAEAHIEIEAADLMRWRACEEYDSGKNAGASAR